MTAWRYGWSGAGHAGVRPEDVVVRDDAPIAGRVELVEQLGEVQLLHVDVGTDEPMIAKVARDARFLVGDTIHLGAEPRHWHVFDADGRAIAPQQVAP